MKTIFMSSTKSKSVGSEVMYHDITFYSKSLPQKQKRVNNGALHYCINSPSGSIADHVNLFLNDILSWIVNKIISMTVYR